ncbi:MFS general substrate transporter [Trametes versicolor FP-101664 SS1]|uniref:MFS general substrate transporter n=1 Tax=Trametes versicolor (strain FP-101664) TaxID=717944 RepID=R7SAM3_TRAVS|nr:MFS general substrate transporter [Trametes versicolor FP-101664 SS1]EIW52009.1 MFS general substrate transporter [Trametes versicolor FP-101664 SS1]
MFEFKVPVWYTSPTAQVVLVGFTCFATAGMFSAVSNLGAGGLSDITLSDTSQGVLYGLFAVTGLVSGGINNLLGPRLTLFLGTLGYAVYVGSLWCYQTQRAGWFVIFAGALEGISAALLWSAQGSIMMSYPLEKDKGKAFSIFFAIFQFGSLLGSIIALAINIESGQLSAVSNSTYIAFLVIIFIGVASSFLVLPPHKVIRSDGTLVKLKASTKLHEEVLGVLRLLMDWRMLALVPMFFASNYFYAYQSAVNTARFDSATRALNATLESAGSIVGALLIGYFCLDFKGLRRRTRGYLGLATVAIVVAVVWSVGLAWQVTFTRADLNDANRINYHDDNYKGKGALFFFYFFSYACYQALAYWIMSALSNDPFTLARYAGLYKAVQSAGAAGAFGMDAVGTPLLNEQLASGIPMLVSFPLAWLVLRTVKETNYGDEEAVYVDNKSADSLEKGSVEDRGNVPASHL